MIRRKKDAWKKLASGLYVPPMLGFAGNPYPCTPPCPGGICYPCSETVIYATSCVEVTFTDALIDNFCSDCDSVVPDDTYILEFAVCPSTWYAHPFLEVNGPMWRYQLDGPCGAEWLECAIYDPGVGAENAIAEVCVTGPSCLPTNALPIWSAIWYKVLAVEEPTCFEIVDLELTEKASFGCPALGLQYCDPNPAGTCVITLSK